MATVDIFDMAQTWNNGSTTFTAIKMDVTDTASAAASLLLDLQIGSASFFNVAKTGDVAFRGDLHLQSAASTASISAGSSKTGSIYIGNDTVSSVPLSVNFSYTAFKSNQYLAWTSNTVNDTADTRLYRDAAGILALRSDTTAQALQVYDTYASGTDYHRAGLKTARATLSSVSGASVTASSLIPDGAVVIGCTTKVTTGLGTGNGTTGYQVGDGSDADRWGSITGTAAGTSSDNTDWTATTVQAFTSANDVVITAVGGNFDGTGDIYVSVQYLIGECD